MKTILRLAVLALAGTAVLAFAGNALATQKLSVKQTTTSLTIKVSQAQTDRAAGRESPSTFRPATRSTRRRQPAARSGRPAARCSRATRASRCRFRVTSSPSRRPPTRPGATRFRTSPCGTSLSAVAGQSINLPCARRPAGGRRSGARRVQARRVPRAGRRSRSARRAAQPNGARLLDATFTVDNIFTVPAGQSIWKAITTP